MDPNATWRLVNTGDATDERAEAALNLLVWLAKGGYTPTAINAGNDGKTRALVVERCELVLWPVLDKADM